MEEKTKKNVIVPRSGNIKEVRRLYRIVERSPFAYEALGESCWDLIIEEGEDRCVLEDAARSEEHARKLSALFEKEGVGVVDAPYVMEELLALADWIE